MFKAIVLCALYNLSDDQVEYQLRDRLSFTMPTPIDVEIVADVADALWQLNEEINKRYEHKMPIFVIR